MLMKKKKESFLQKIQNKYRLIIINEDTYEERVSFRISKLNIFSIVSFSAIIIIVSVSLIIAYTPLKEYIPGYTDTKLRRQILQNEHLVDSLMYVQKTKDLFFNNIKNIVNGNIVTTDSIPTIKKISGIDSGSGNYQPVSTSEIDSNKSNALKKLESEMTLEQNFSLNTKHRPYIPKLSKPAEELHKMVFFPPLIGPVTNDFKPESGHLGIDIVSDNTETIKATLNGTVFIATWTLETGYIIGIQHDNNLTSFYKHNSKLLKKTGNYVKAGEPIAIIGNSGELSTGTHLHFELWHAGKPVNPADYIRF